jgi:hypothetical protein
VTDAGRDLAPKPSWGTNRLVIRWEVLSWAVVIGPDRPDPTRRLLETIAGGAPGARLTRDAAAALKRPGG